MNFCAVEVTWRLQNVKTAEIYQYFAFRKFKSHLRKLEFIIKFNFPFSYQNFAKKLQVNRKLHINVNNTSDKVTCKSEGHVSFPSPQNPNKKYSLKKKKIHHRNIHWWSIATTW